MFLLQKIATGSWSQLAASCSPIVAFLLFLYYRRRFAFWTFLGVKGPRPTFFFGNTWEFFFNPISELDSQHRQLYGKIYGVYDGVSPVLIVGDPIVAHRILDIDFNNFPENIDLDAKEPINCKFLRSVCGKDWKRIRTAKGPNFSSLALLKIYDTMNGFSVKLANDLSLLLDEGRDVVLKTFFISYVSDILANCCFGTQMKPFESRNNPFALKYHKVRQLNQFLGIYFPKWVSNCSHTDERFYHKAGHFFRDIVQRLLKEKDKRKGNKPNDFVQLLIEAGAGKCENQEETFVANGLYENAQDLVYSLFKTKATLSNDEVIAQAISFLAAGYEISTTLLAFCCYALTIYPEIQEQLYQELRTSTEPDGLIPYDTMVKLPFINAVLSETLRVFPTELRIERKSIEEYHIPEYGICIPKKTTVNIAVYPMHHDPEYFQEPDKFRPERFLSENRNPVKAMSYLPFGGDSRACPKIRFALLKTKLALSSILLRFKFSKSDKTQVPPRLVNQISKIAAISLIVNVDRRL